MNSMIEDAYSAVNKMNSELEHGTRKGMKESLKEIREVIKTLDRCSMPRPFHVLVLKHVRYPTDEVIGVFQDWKTFGKWVSENVLDCLEYKIELVSFNRA